MVFENPNPFFDFGIWPNIKRREDDVIIATYAKFGPLRMQQIVAKILAKAGKVDVENIDSPWVELRSPNSAEKILEIDSLAGPRVLRTHLSAPEVYQKTGKYIYVGRDPRDLIWNLYQFHLSANESWMSYFAAFGFTKAEPGLVFQDYWESWVDHNGAPFWSYFDRLKTWWTLKAEDNVLFLHYLDFKNDMVGVIQTFCEFLNLSFSQTEWADLIKECDYSDITNASERETAFHNPFWNGGMTRTAKTLKVEPKSSWRDDLDSEHKTALIGQLDAWVGVAGRQWVLYGD